MSYIPSLHSTFEFIENCPIQSIDLPPNRYLFEAWGASGGGNFSGRGGYTSGVIKINEKTTFYIIVGGQGGEAQRTTEKIPGGCNGGGKGGGGGIQTSTNLIFMSGCGGGGATDVRTQNSKDALSERILVAAGGGGSCDNSSNRGAFGHAGGSIGLNSTGPYNISAGAGQNYGFDFGIGQDGVTGSSGGSSVSNGGEGNGGGGGGWYGGYSYQGTGKNSNAGGGGGSSYISGHNDCIKHSSYVFSRPTLKAGNEKILSPNGSEEVGHYGNGYFKISVLVLQPSCKNIILHQHYLIIFLTLFELNS